MNDQIASKPDAGDGLIEAKEGNLPATDRLQQFMDDIEAKFNGFLLGASGVRIPSYSKDNLPPVPPAEKPSMIYVDDEAGGAIPAFSDGTNWRRCTDRAVVS